MMKLRTWIVIGLVMALPMFTIGCDEISLRKCLLMPAARAGLEGAVDASGDAIDAALDGVCDDSLAGNAGQAALAAFTESLFGFVADEYVLDRLPDSTECNICP